MKDVHHYALESSTPRTLMGYLFKK